MKSITLPLLLLSAAVLLPLGCHRAAEPADDGHGHSGHAHSDAQKPGESVAICREHGVPEAECAICQPEKAAQLAAGESMKVRLPSTNSAAVVGIQTAPPGQGTVTGAVECMAELSFDLNQLAQVTAPVGGILQSVDVDLGDHVQERQTLARVWSANIAEAVAKAVLTHQTLDRERKLRQERVTSQKDLQEAEAAHRSACQQLRTLGFTEAQIEELGGKPQEQVLLEVRAPFAGEITDRTAVRGALLEPGKPLFTVVDCSIMWATLFLPEAALQQVKPGQAIELRVDSLPGRVFPGKLTWLSPSVDERTRMARARAELPNPDRVLRDKMFATARILTRPSSAALLVPRGAVQSVGGKPFVFVKLAEDLYAARVVRLGSSAAGQQEILAGLQSVEEIAITHTFALKSAMLMSRLGAGCADD